MISLFLDLFGFPDLRHICQNLNQFGHGRGTIYGGNKVAFCSCKFTNTVTWTVNKNIWEQFIGCLFLQGLPSIPLFQLAIVINWRQISMLTRPAYWNVRELMCKSLAWDLWTRCVYNIRWLRQRSYLSYKWLSWRVWEGSQTAESRNVDKMGTRNCISHRWGGEWGVQ